MRTIGCSWKFRIKRDSSRAITKYKTRLVARGDMQHLDFAFAFAPTVRYTTLLVLLALACHYDLEIEQMHGVSAFLHADVVSDIYMEQSEGYYTPSTISTRLVCNLDKAFYGIEPGTLSSSLGLFPLASPNHPLTRQSSLSPPPPFSTF